MALNTTDKPESRCGASAKIPKLAPSPMRGKDVLVSKAVSASPENKPIIIDKDPALVLEEFEEKLDRFASWRELNLHHGEISYDPKAICTAIRQIDKNNPFVKSRLARIVELVDKGYLSDSEHMQQILDEVGFALEKNPTSEDYMKKDALNVLKRHAEYVRDHQKYQEMSDAIHDNLGDSYWSLMRRVNTYNVPDEEILAAIKMADMADPEVISYLEQIEDMDFSNVVGRTAYLTLSDYRDRKEQEKALDVLQDFVEKTNMTPLPHTWICMFKESIINAISLADKKDEEVRLLLRDIVKLDSHGLDKEIVENAEWALQKPCY